MADLGFWRLNPGHWQKCDNISIDYAIMETAKNLEAISLKGNWSDLGDWNSVWEETAEKVNGVGASKNTHAIDCQNVLIRSENATQEVVGLGLKDTIVIATPDAVLVANKKRSQDVKLIVDKLKQEEIPQAEKFPKVHKPWGWYESLSTSNNCHVKRIHVNPRAALSLQSHEFRSEHWVVVEGRAKVRVDKKTRILSQGESIYVPVGAIHRLENTENFPMTMIEVQTGSYFGEDDIIRYEDLYSRKTNDN